MARPIASEPVKEYSLTSNEVSMIIIALRKIRADSFTYPAYLCFAAGALERKLQS